MTPTFFSKELTGKQKQDGIFNPRFALQNTSVAPLNPDLIDTPYFERKSHYQKQVRIPTYLISRKAFRNQRNIGQLPYENAQTVLVEQNRQISVSLPVHSIEMLFRGTYTNRRLDQVQIVYEPTIWINNDQNQIYQQKDNWQVGNSLVIKNYLANPKKWFEQELTKIDPTKKWQTKFDEWFKQYNLYDQLNLQADYLQNHLGELGDALLDNNLWGEKILNNLASYNENLSSYRTFYDVMLKHNLSQDRLIDLLSANEYLLLIANLEQLHGVRNYLPCVNNQYPCTSTQYNKQQLAAINTNQPLNLLQSVAGSGKSHTILGRIRYLLYLGVPAKNITAISFTNAAADHITDKIKKPINSLTIAKMLHTIYQANMKQELSTIPTVINSLKLSFGLNNDTVNSFIYYLNRLNNGEKQAQTQLLHFVNKNYSNVVQMLTIINQTTLELEEIFCYLNANAWQDPFETQVLIVDEVQDTSIFQFIYLLHFATVKKLNLMLVGDASQTLYAFRDADPNALNALESTKYFKTFKLETNYRSKPGILLFANSLLANIKANQYAHLQLHAQDFDAQGHNLEGGPSLTRSKFKDEVQYTPNMLGHAEDINKASLKLLYQNGLHNFLNEGLAQHEKIAFLGYTQKEAKSVEEALNELYPDKKIALLYSSRGKATNIISSYLSKYAQELNYLPLFNFVDMLEKAIIGKIKTLDLPYKGEDALWPLLRELQKQAPERWNMLLTQMSNNQITKQQAINYFKNFLMQFEINYNVEQQQLLDDANKDSSEEVDQADFIIATIHAVKGLEFDRTVILLTDTNRMTQEERRLYYVALTRAKNKEALIDVNNGTSLIAMLYDQCQNNLSN